ncbi:hypothetical protein VD0002_g3450 [Verticillium dahliae]|uniref:Uncharacterized protein n=1 Tax=Verticillium dahliae TaxID=27337 RepID=A0AA44WK72_VERDA|nr:hypothetical protein BJF96_g4199 [Verticillium dahliae]PNH53159.1 hypothetical protein VD0003_g4222 [Verticillium dahliae]PNH65622.1 hypothetical protein VD0002_g3450 [Verticillium dahliae]
MQPCSVPGARDVVARLFRGLVWWTAAVGSQVPLWDRTVGSQAPLWDPRGAPAPAPAPAPALALALALALAPVHTDVGTPR